MTESEVAQDPHSAFQTVANGDQVIIHNDERVVATINPPDLGSGRSGYEYLETLDNFQHQIKTPIALAHRKVRRLLEDPRSSNAELQILAALIARADQVASNGRLFVTLARGTDIETHCVKADGGIVASRIRELASELTLLSPREITYFVDADSFSVLDSVSILVDLELLDHMVANILDNAGKYSYKDSAVTIKAGLRLRAKYFFISVTNQGLPISPAFAARLGKRRQRSESAEQANPQGSGIGVLIAREILLAHNGELEIDPTNEQGLTTFRLLFPVRNA